nr:hydrogenase maturation peptidase HycI [Methanothermus fervidus]
MGNELRSDDGIGPYIVSRLPNNKKVVLLNAGTAPDKFTWKIKIEDPSHILIIDAINMGKKPGKIEFIDKKEIAEYEMSSTHSIPLSYTIKYLESQGNYKIGLVGIQPKNLNIDTKISYEVKKAGNKLIKILSDILN